MARKNNTSKVVIFGLITVAILFFGTQYFLLEDTGDQIVQDEVEELADETSVIESGAADEVTNLSESDQGENYKLAEIGEFSEYIIENAPDATGMLGGEFTENALDHLVDALEEIAKQPEVILDQAAISSIETQIKQFEEGADADKVVLLKSAMLTAHGLLETTGLAEHENVVTYLEDWQQAVYDLEDNTPLDEQTQQVEYVFGRIALVLEAIEEHI